MRHPDAYPYRITREDLRIPVAGEVELYARVWRPVTDEPVPALLEYLPYRLTDWTAPRDAERHPWYAGHGYASVRVDIRGHGNSGGLPGGEHDAQELADGVAVIEWLAARPGAPAGSARSGSAGAAPARCNWPRWPPNRCAPWSPSAPPTTATTTTRATSAVRCTARTCTPGRPACSHSPPARRTPATSARSGGGSG